MENERKLDLDSVNSELRGMGADVKSDNTEIAAMELYDKVLRSKVEGDEYADDDDGNDGDDGEGVTVEGYFSGLIDGIVKDYDMTTEEAAKVVKDYADELATNGVLPKISNDEDAMIEWIERAEDPEINFGESVFDMLDSIAEESD